MSDTATVDQSSLVDVDRRIAEAQIRHAKHQDPVSKAANEITMNLLLDERFALAPIPTELCKPGNALTNSN